VAVASANHLLSTLNHHMSQGHWESHLMISNFLFFLSLICHVKIIFFGIHILLFSEWQTCAFCTSTSCQQMTFMPIFWNQQSNDCFLLLAWLCMLHLCNEHDIYLFVCLSVILVDCEYIMQEKVGIDIWLYT